MCISVFPHFSFSLAALSLRTHHLTTEPKKLNDLFPIRRERASPTTPTARNDDHEPPKDASAFPFQALTNKGAAQMEALGTFLRAHILSSNGNDIGSNGGYSRNCPTSLSSSLSSASAFKVEVEAQSTNYRRTQLSGQFFLRGLLLQQEDDDDDDNTPHSMQKRDSKKKGVEKGSGKEGLEEMGSSEETRVVGLCPIYVPKPSTINPFDELTTANTTTTTTTKKANQFAQSLSSQLLSSSLSSPSSQTDRIVRDGGSTDLWKRCAWIASNSHSFQVGLV
jgi:hypothetical protein